MSDWKQRILEAKELLDMGAITDSDFQQIKADALAAMRGTPAPARAF